MLFVSVAKDSFHRVGVAPFSQPAGSAFLTSLECERVYFGGNRGLCLTSSSSGAENPWSALIFDERYTPLGRVPLNGAPSRVRVSQDGAFAASTVFASGHSYAGGGFSTVTAIFDLKAGISLGDLEQFETRRDGQVIKAADFNFWGVTFSRDSDMFYATLDTGGVSYLVKGRVRQRTMEVLRAGVECPSLSPNNTRIAFKKRIGARSQGWWQIAVLDLASMNEAVIARETRSVDDQVEWLDDDRVIYHLTGGQNAADLWSVRVDNSADPELVRAAAYSPAIVR